jgi:hypothetical protein
MGLVQRMHFLAKRSPKHSAQYGFSSRDVNFSPASSLVAVGADEAVAMPRCTLVRHSSLVDHLSNITHTPITCQHCTCHNMLIVMTSIQYRIISLQRFHHNEQLKKSSLQSYPVTLHAALGIVLLIAGHAHHFLVTWDETLCSDWLTTYLAAEALFMPLLALVLKLLHSCKEGPSLWSLHLFYYTK